jgi:hypothetical protein
MRAFLSTLFLPISLPGNDLLEFRRESKSSHRKSDRSPFRFALSRLDHHCARDWKRHGRRMETIIHQPLRDVFHLDARALELPQIHDALMRHEAAAPL